MADSKAIRSDSDATFVLTWRLLGAQVVVLDWDFKKLQQKLI